MPNVPLTKKPTDNKKYIEAAFCIICNMTSLCDHSASWEILVSGCHLMDYNRDGEMAVQILVFVNLHARGKLNNNGVKML